jgi:hypothetical protein
MRDRVFRFELDEERKTTRVMVSGDGEKSTKENQAEPTSGDTTGAVNDRRARPEEHPRGLGSDVSVTAYVLLSC